MKEHLRQLVARADNDLARGWLAREYLQARALESLQEAGVFLRWAFMGGTALRFLFDIPRFSEDLDFSVIARGQHGDIRRALAEVKRGFVLEGYALEVTASIAKTVASAWLRFPGLPHELGFSPHASQTLSIKVEVDTNPPPGARIETTVVRRHVTLHLCHHDKASLLAGKLHAVLSRPWTKGRDLYDLAWYLADRAWPAPNLELLNAALAQTGWTGPILTEMNWRGQLRQRLSAVDWAKARSDVRPFLERDRDLRLVTADVLGSLLSAGEQRPGRQ
jgi:hypothetical protein